MSGARAAVLLAAALAGGLVGGAPRPARAEGTTTSTVAAGASAEDLELAQYLEMLEELELLERMDLVSLLAALEEDEP